MSASPFPLQPPAQVGRILDRRLVEAEDDGVVHDLEDDETPGDMLEAGRPLRLAREDPESVVDIQPDQDRGERLDPEGLADLAAVLLEASECARVVEGVAAGRTRRLSPRGA